MVARLAPNERTGETRRARLIADASDNGVARHTGMFAFECENE